MDTDTNVMPRESAEEARAAVIEMIDSLQEAQFAARRLEQYLPADRRDRLVDRIHALRVLAEHFRAQLDPQAA